MKRKLLLILLTLLPIVANAYNAYIGGIYYNFSGDEATVTYKNTSYNSYKGSVIIPETITYNGITYSVTSIDNYAFSRCSGLTSINIPESVTSIGDGAFSGCSSLTSITIPNSVTSIGDGAFSGCSSLTSITIPNSVTSIGDDAFSGCSGLSSITIPNSVTSIGNYAFSGCSSLTSVSIGNSVTSIGERAFSGCSSLTSINIPNGVTSIGGSAFYNCSGLTSITLNSNAITSTTYSSKDNLATKFGSQVKEYILGYEIKRIGSYAFASSTELTSIVMGKNIDRIQEYAFSGCGKLEEVRIENPEPPIAFENAFHTNAYYAVLYVPEGSQAEYKEDNVWKKFSRIRTFKDIQEKCILSIKSAIGGYVEMECNKQASYTFMIKAEMGWQISSVSFNGKDVTANITDGNYTTPLLEGDSELNIVFEMDAESIDDVANVDGNEQLHVTASGSAIYIHNGKEPVSSFIYTIDGKQVKSVVVPYGTTKIPVQPNNVYIVKAYNRTFKVAI